MNAVQLAALLAAIMAAADVPDDVKDRACKAVTADYANDTSTVSDADAVDMMPPDVQAAYNSADATEEDKRTNLAASKQFVRKVEARQILQTVKAGGTVNSKDGQAGKGGGEVITKEDLRRSQADTLAAVNTALTTAFDKERTRDFGTLGGQPSKLNAQKTGDKPTRQDNPGGDFYKDKVAPLLAQKVSRPEALKAARKADPEGFKRWQASQHSR